MIYELCKGREIVMDEFGKKIKEALNEAVNGFEVSDDVKKRIEENIKNAENDMPLGKTVK